MDLPVGQRLYDHLMFLGLTFKINESITMNLAENLKTFPDYLMSGKGPLTCIGK